MKSANGAKKIAFVADAVYPFNKGGKEKRLYEITKRLAAEGHQVTIYCMHWWSGGDAFTQDGVTLRAISPYYPLYDGNRRSIKEAIFFAINCLKLISKDFDILEADCVPHLHLFSVKLICLLRRKKMSVAWHEVWGKTYWRSYLGTIKGTVAYWIEWMASRIPDVIISVSDHTTAALRETLHVRKEIITIPNGFDLGMIAELDATRPGADVIFAGRLLAHKNVDVLLRAMAILVKHRPSTTLIVVGDGPERENLKAISRSLGIERNVSFLGFMNDHEELYRLMRASKVFVLPSTREGFGIAALEANACGLPVITVDHRQNATKDLIIEGENGAVVALGATELADAIGRSLELRKGREVYQKYAERYSWGNIISAIHKIYTL